MDETKARANGTPGKNRGRNTRTLHACLLIHPKPWPVTLKTTACLPRTPSRSSPGARHDVSRRNLTPLSIDNSPHFIIGQDGIRSAAIPVGRILRAAPARLIGHGASLILISLNRRIQTQANPAITQAQKTATLIDAEMDIGVGGEGR